MKLTKYNHCTRKKPYLSRKQVKNKIEYILSNSPELSELHYYRCRFCFNYHISKAKGSILLNISNYYQYFKRSLTL